MDAKFLAYVLIGLFLGPIASLAITPLFCLLRKIFYLPFIRKELIEKAKRKGHVIEAHLQKKHTLMEHTKNGMLPTMREMGTYIYHVNNKKYVYQHITTLGLHDTITLYYIKNLERQLLVAI